MKLLQSAWQVLSENRHTLLIMNLLYFGFVGAAMLIASLDRSIQDALVNAIGQSVSEGPLGVVSEAYTSGDVIPAILLTLGFNLFLGTLIQISMPSLIIPFSGLLVALFRAVLWGFIFSPQPEFIALENAASGLLIIGLLLLEGEGYVLGMLGVWIHGKSFLQPAIVGASSSRDGYKEGLRKHLLVYPWITLVLIVAAVYEVVISVFILPG